MESRNELMKSLVDKNRSSMARKNWKSLKTPQKNMYNEIQTNVGTVLKLINNTPNPRKTIRKTVSKNKKTKGGKRKGTSKSKTQKK